MTVLKTNRLILTTPKLDDAAEMLDYRRRNKLRFAPLEPKRDESFFTIEAAQARIAMLTEKMQAQQSLYLLLKEPGSDVVIGECGFSQIMRGPFESCVLGYSICESFEGKGYMYEALQCAIEHVFDELKLHRVGACLLPDNERSLRLLRRLGFEQEGLARTYMKLNGVWQDQLLMALINKHYS